MKRSGYLSRRTALRGIGACLALPLLEAMPASTGAQAAPPQRLLFVYAPNGKHMAAWTPATEGAGFALPPLLSPLQDVRDELLVLSGLTLRPADSNGDGPGDHARAMAAFLTGCRPHRTAGADLRVGVSIDQVAAGRLGAATRFASLEIGCEGGRTSGVCDNGYSCAYQTNLSWRTPTTPLSKETNPRLLFERLFGRPEADGRSAAWRDRSSILDFVTEDARQLREQLGAPDRRRLDEYLTGLREIEQRLQRAQPVVDVGQGQLTRPTGIPQDFREHARLMSDLLVLAFQADLTRIATFVFANDGSNRSYREVGVSDGHHDVSHHGGDAAKLDKIQRVNRLHVEQLAYLLGRLRSAREGGDTLLGRSMVVYGSGISDGDRHNHDNLPILLAGRGGGVRPGRHVRYAAGTPLTNLYLALLHRMGVELPTFGDATGRLESL
jgi:hypothetical protein